MYFISPKHVLYSERTAFSFFPTVICGVKLNIIKLKTSLNSPEYNALDKPQIIVIKAVETPQYNGWSTNSTVK